MELSSICNMISHIVLLKLSESATENDINIMSQGLKSLVSIEGVVSVECGRTTDKFYDGYSHRHQGYNFCLIVILKDVNSLKKYEKDDYHIEVKNKCIIPNLDKSKDAPVLAVDVDNCKFQNIISNPLDSNLILPTLCIIAFAVGSIFIFPILRSRL